MKRMLFLQRISSIWGGMRNNVKSWRWDFHSNVNIERIGSPAPFKPSTLTLWMWNDSFARDASGKTSKREIVFWLIFDLCNKLIFQTRKESKIWYIEKGRWRRIRLKKSNQDIIQQIFMQPMTSETWKGEWIHSRITLGRTIYQVNLFYL